MSEFSTVTQVGEAYIYGSATPTSQGGGIPTSPNILGHLRRNGLTYSDDIWCANTCGEWEYRV